MKLAEVRALPLGLYRVHWKTGGYSYAAIGMSAAGARWLAPTNWCEPSSDPKIWRMVDFVTHIGGHSIASTPRPAAAPKRPTVPARAAGGHARMAKTTPEQRRAIAAKGAAARWRNRSA